jgi:hypothetical protein
MDEWYSLTNRMFDESEDPHPDAPATGAEEALPAPLRDRLAFRRHLVVAIEGRDHRGAL